MQVYRCIEGERRGCHPWLATDGGDSGVDGGKGESAMSGCYATVGIGLGQRTP